jgi:hypothetical protein
LIDECPINQAEEYFGFVPFSNDGIHTLAHILRLDEGIVLKPLDIYAKPILGEIKIEAKI